MIWPVDFPNPRAVQVRTTKPLSAKNCASDATDSLLPPKPCAIKIAGAGTLAGRYKEVSMEMPGAVVIVRSTIEFAEADNGERPSASRVNASRARNFTLQR